MRTEAEVKARIKELESICDPDDEDVEEDGGYDEDCYLDEGQQSELSTLYWVLEEDENQHLK